MVWVPGNAIEHAHCGLIVRGDLEVPVQEALRRTLAPGAVLYDVGANIGFFSLVGARLAGPEGRVYAFEPVAANAAAIRRNMELNGVGNVRVVERALSDAPGRARLQLVEDLSWSRLEATGAHPLTTEIVEVELATVDDLVATGEVPPPAAVKIDVEGSELEVLRGMEETIRGQGPAIVCELHGTGAAFAELMRSFGYAVQNLDGTGPVEASDALGHALALPSI
jgi:FkbM family methyltransferase